MQIYEIRKSIGFIWFVSWTFIPSLSNIGERIKRRIVIKPVCTVDH